MEFPAMQHANFAPAAVVACLLSVFAEPALANVSCPADLHGIPLIPGRPGEPQPGQAVEIPGFEGAYSTNCSYAGRFLDTGKEGEDVEKYVEIRIVAKWHTVPDGDHFGCYELRGIKNGEVKSSGGITLLAADSPSGLGGTLFAKDQQAMVDVTVTDGRYYSVANAQGSTMLQEVVGLAGKCREAR
jgi:hypothetical protein